MTPQPEWFDTNYYAVLGVDEQADAKEITKAYRKLARQYHPDQNPGDAAAEERFKEVSAAYEVLGDESTRTEYDQVRTMGPMGGPGGGGFGPGGFSPGAGSFSTEDLGGLGDLLGGLFNRRGRGGMGGPGMSGAARPAGPQRGADLRAGLTMAFRDAVTGITTTLSLTTDATCRTCSGSGARPGTHPEPCQVCQGRGVIEDNQGLFSFSRPCDVCHGQGVLVLDPCPTCAGRGVEARARSVKVRIPAGVADGKTIKLKGRGAPGRNGGPPGDLYVEVAVQPDPTFGRKGRDLTVHVPVSFTEAALGATVTVPTLDGSPVKVKVPAGSQPGRVLRVRGRGIVDARGTGDLLVTVDLTVPTSLTDEQRTAVEALAEALEGRPEPRHADRSRATMDDEVPADASAAGGEEGQS